MIDIHAEIQNTTANALKELFDKEVEASSIAITDTRKDFEGDFTIVTFPFAKMGIGAPPEIADKLGAYLVENLNHVVGFNVVKGFLNLSLSDSFWIEWARGFEASNVAGPSAEKIVIEYSSPNTNKPLHLGHLRNNFLGDSVSRILKAVGHDVNSVCLYNDRGIAICKTMVAYLRSGEGASPESAAKKGDFFVVDFYVQFGAEMGKEAAEILVSGGLDPEAAQYAMLGKTSFDPPLEKEKEAELKAAAAEFMKSKGLDKHQVEDQTGWMKEARDLLIKWEQDDPEVRALWKKLNDWVYDGFEETYKSIGVGFDKNYYESQTYKLGTHLVEKGLNDGVFFKKDDGSVWVDLTDDGLDQKAVLRADGTAMYITQDMGTAEMRHEDFKMDRSLYVVANEQDYHFKVLKLILQKLGFEWANGIEHFSYGMVDLPSGKMKSREGTTVDADHLVAEVVAQAAAETEEKGKTEGMEAGELQELYHTLAVGALKFFILRVDPKKRMVFDPKDSVSLEGDTGPFIQYAHARTASVQRKAGEIPADGGSYTTIDERERALIRHLFTYHDVVRESAEKLSPALVANFALDLAKEFNRFWHDVSILQAEDQDATAFRLGLVKQTGAAIKHSMGLLGINVPDRM